MARIVTIMAMTPAKVQKIAAVFVQVSKTVISTLNDSRNAYIEPRQPLVSQSRHGIAQQGDGNKEQEDLVVGALKDADTGLFFKHIDAPDEEESGAEVDRQGDCDVADDIEPATSPARDAAPVGGREHKGRSEG